MLPNQYDMKGTIEEERSKYLEVSEMISVNYIKWNKLWKSILSKSLRIRFLNVGKVKVTLSCLLRYVSSTSYNYCVA